MRQSFTAVVERNVTWQGEFVVEPYEAAWATEAIYFVRALNSANMPSDITARVQISPDGINWCDEGTMIPLPQTPSAPAAGNAALTFGRVSHFGGWLRLVGKLPDTAQLTVIVYLVLKE